jgi:Ca-activated chloride channel family protein
MRLESPLFLILFFFLFLIYFLQKRFSKQYQTPLRFSKMESAMVNTSGDWKIRAVKVLPAARWISYGLIVVALARPQSGLSYQEYITEGLDIMLLVDASGSMMAEDFAPKNRLEVAKERMVEFIQERKGDRIGVVVFGEESFTLCPLTTDYMFLRKRIEDLNIGIVPEEKTGIGIGLMNALNRLKKSDAKTKIIILLTDGVNNTGNIEPLTAAEVSKTMGIKVYTIGVGKDGIVRIPVQHPVLGKQYAQMKTDIDEKTLLEIAEKTGGLYFRATTENALQSIYRTIDKMEKTKIETKIYTDYKELFPFLLWPAFLLLFFERVSARTFLRVLP